MMPNKAKGQIRMILGPMFSGKTSELIRLCKRYQIAKYICRIVKYARDQRYSDDGVATHDRQTLRAISTISLADVLTELQTADVIGIDEAQFFPDTVEICELLANQGKTVIVAALDGTFQRESFGRILELIPKAEHVTKLTAVCMQCCGNASFTKRKNHDQAVEVIGGAETYSALCRECYFDKTPSNPGLTKILSPRRNGDNICQHDKVGNRDKLMQRFLTFDDTVESTLNDLLV